MRGWGRGWGGKRATTSLKMQKIMSVSPRISGTGHHMIACFGTRVSNDDIFSKVFHFFKIFNF